MNEQEILAAMATADHGERAMLNRQLIQLRAARRTATQAQSEAVLGAQSVEYLTPGTENMRHSASTDWINQIAVDHRGDDEIRREATVEAQRWLATKSALVRSDPEELGTQALGYANLWSGQFLQSGTTAKVAFLQRVASLVHIALIPETEDLFEEARKAKVRADAEADANKIASKTADAVVPVVGLPKGPDDEFNEGEWTQNGTIDHSLMATMPMSLATRKTAGDKWRVVQDVGTPGKWVVQKWTDNWGVWGDMGDAVDSQQAAYTKMDAWQADEREFPMESEGSRRTGALFHYDDHAANDPSTWTVERAGNSLWHLKTKDGTVLQGYPTRTKAQEGAQSGFLVDLYNKEKTWYAGGTVNGWKPFDQSVIDSQRQIRGGSRKTAADFTPPPINSAADARNAAIDWQNWMSEQNLSMGEFGDWENYFEDLAAKYPELKEEFQENGIIGFDDPRYSSRKTAVIDTAAVSFALEVARATSQEHPGQVVFSIASDAQEGSFGSSPGMLSGINFTSSGDGDSGPVGGWMSVETARAALDAIRADGLRTKGSLKMAADSDPYVILRVLNTNRTLEQVQAYMYSPWSAQQIEDGTIFISGHDDGGGFGLQAQRDRLLSGLIGTEIWDSNEGGTGAVGGRPVGYVGSVHTAGNPYPVGSSMWFDWDARVQNGEQPEGSGPFDSGAPGGGIPLHGPLSPEQEAWMKRRGSVPNDPFWAKVHEQYEALKSAKSAADVMRILDVAAGPPGYDDAAAGKAFFAGGGGDETVREALQEAGWRTVWAEAWYYWVMQAPDGSQITYVEGDVYEGDRHTASRTAAGDATTWVSDGDDATDGGEPSWTSTAPPMETQDHEKLWTDVPVGSSLGSRQLRHQAGVTWYPDMDSAGNMNPSGYGMVVEDEESSIGGGYSVVNNGCSWDQAQSMYPGVNRASHTIPVTVDAHVHSVAAVSKTAATSSELRSQNADLFAGADAAYDREDRDWFYNLSQSDLAILWDSVSGHNFIDMEGPWDDEVADALADSGYDFGVTASYEKPEEDVILPENTCSVCGDAIEKNDGEEGYHHDNGEKHDHEAKPGSSKESRRTASAYDVMMGQAGPDAGVVRYKPRQAQYWTTTHFSDQGDLERLLDGQARMLDMTGMYDTSEDDAKYSDVLVFQFPGAGANSDAYVWQGSLAASPTLMQFSGSRKTATLSDEELQPIADSYGMTLEELKAALDAQVAPWDHEKYAAFENPPGKQLGENVVVTDNTDGVAFGWIVDDEGDKIEQDSINEDHGSELKKDASAYTDGYMQAQQLGQLDPWWSTTGPYGPTPEQVEAAQQGFADAQAGLLNRETQGEQAQLFAASLSRDAYFNPAWADQGASGSQSSDDDFVYAPRKERHAYTKWVDDQAHANPDGWTPPSFDDWSAGHTGSRKMADLDMNRLGEAINAQDFDHCFTLHPDGSITDAPGVYAPSVFHDESNDIEIDGSGWTAMTGLTGQDSYSGAVMHASEYIGSGVASVMMELVEDGPKTFVITTVEVMPEGDDDEPEPAGWTILYRDARTASRTAEWKDTFLEKNDGPKEDSTTEVVPIVGEPADDTAMFEPSDELNGHWKPPKKPTTSQRVSALDHSLFE